MNKRLLQGGLAWLGLFIIIGVLTTGIKFYFTATAEIQALQVQQEYYESVLKAQVKRSISNQARIDNQFYMDIHLSNRIENNLDYINRDSKQIIENKIEIDRISYEGIETIIIELEQDIKRLEKRVE